MRLRSDYFWLSGCLHIPPIVCAFRASATSTTHTTKLIFGLHVLATDGKWEPEVLIRFINMHGWTGRKGSTDGRMDLFEIGSKGCFSSHHFRGHGHGIARFGRGIYIYIYPGYVVDVAVEEFSVGERGNTSPTSPQCCQSHL
jgi:hypothetical protein